MEFLTANADVILGSIVAINAVLTRIPKVAENDLFQIFGTIVKNMLTKVVTVKK